jgi:transposase InsO family protein
VWLADVSYLWTDERWLYLACVLDLYSRAIVGWAMIERNDRDLSIVALVMAHFRRRPAGGLLHHSDAARPTAATTYRI